MGVGMGHGLIGQLGRRIDGQRVIGRVAHRKRQGGVGAEDGTGRGEDEVGGLEEMAKINHAKAKVLYDYLDGQDFYNNPVQPEYRSMMNVTFTSPNPDMDKKFCAAATEAGFVNLKGHRLVGGMRASIYNAMPAQGVNDLVDFMEKFRKENA